MKIKKARMIVFGIALVIAVFGTGCGKSSGGESATGAVEGKTGGDAEKEELTVVHIGFPSSGSDWAGGTLAAAEEYGYLDEYLEPLGYDAELTGFTGAAPAIHEALVSENLDYAYYAGFAGIAARSNGIDTRLLAVTSFGSNWQLVVRTDSDINSLAELKGKKIAYQRGATPQMYVLKVLKEAGLTEEDVELVNSNIPEGISGLTTGALDGAVISFGQTDELVKDGTLQALHAGIDADEDVFFEPTVLTGRAGFVEQNKELNLALIKALLKAKDKIKEDPDSFYQLTSEKSGTPLDQVRGVAVEDLDVAYPLNLDERYMDSLENIGEFELENEIIGNPIDYGAWMDASYVDQANKEYMDEK